MPPAFRFAGAGVLPGSGLGNRSSLRSSRSAPAGACPAYGRRCPCGWTFWFYGVIAGYPMQTVMRLSRYGAEFGNKKSPHNNLNLTIPSGMALVRVCYVAIRKLKTCSAPLRKRALLRTRHFLQCARKRNGNFGKKREPDGLVLLICFLPAVPDRVPVPHPPARRKCPPGCDTRRPERPDLPLPGTR